LSTGFSMSNGPRQGVLSPYFFARYVRDLISSIVNSGVGCKLSDRFINILRGVDPYGTGGTRPPNIWTGGDMITNVPPIFLE